MTAYVPKGTLEVGDQVVVELRKCHELLAIIQCSIVRSVEPSQWHKHEEMDEVEF